LFLYTGLVSIESLKEYLFELYDLSTHFEVKALRNACIQELYDSLSMNNVETYLSHVSTRTHDLHLATMYAAYIADHVRELVRKDFLFHKIGKVMLPLVFKRLGDIDDHYSRINYRICAKPLKDPKDIGNPEDHCEYRMFKEGNYSDFALNWNGSNYSLHRCVLSSESLYFQTLFNSEWKESNSGQLNLPQETSISKEAFEVFLVYCYTQLITKETLVDFFFELRELSDYFQVQNLTKLLDKGIQSFVTTETAGKVLITIRERGLVELHSFMVKYIVDNFRELVRVGFPFHRMGKNMLTKVLKKLTSDETIDVETERAAPEDEKDEEIEEY
jgi:hypothetical protein